MESRGGKIPGRNSLELASPAVLQPTHYKHGTLLWMFNTPVSEGCVSHSFHKNTSNFHIVVTL